MPIYEYRCDDCGHVHEHLCKLNSHAVTTCPDCHSHAYHKLLSATASIAVDAFGDNRPICPTTGQTCGRCYER